MIFQSVSSKKIIHIASELNLLIKAGLPINQAINLIISSEKHAYTKNKLHQLKKKLQKGLSFTEAFSTIIPKSKVCSFKNSPSKLNTLAFLDLISKEYKNQNNQKKKWLKHSCTL